MEPTTQPEYRSPASRLGIFLRDFLLEQNLQLLFPLGSFLLLLGASHPWYRFPISGVRFDAVANQAQAEQFIRSTNAWAGWEQLGPELLVRFAFFASIVLWTLPLRKVISRFGGWVYLPASLAVVGYPAFLAATAVRRNAALDALVSSVHLPISVTHSWLRLLGDGLYLTLGGLIVLGVALLLVCQGKVSLPLRFRDPAQVQGPIGTETSRDERDVFSLVIGTVIWAAISSVVLLLPGMLGKPLSWSGSFSAYEWLPALATAAVSAWIALLLFRGRAYEFVRVFIRKQPFQEYAFAVAIPFIAVVAPRILFRVFSDLPLSPIGSGGWSELLPGPLPRILVVYAIALFEEVTLRGYLQGTLEKHFSLKRSIFLTGLLWAILPLGYGTALSLPPGNYVRIPGVPFLILAAVQIIYSIPLGWLFARTGSILPVALMHGTIALFHLGYGHDIHINHPQFYWAELALWIFIGWYLFKKYPLESTESPREPEVAPA